MKDKNHHYVYRVRNRETKEYSSQRVWWNIGHAKTHRNRKFFEIVRFKVDLDSMEVVEWLTNGM